MKSQGSSYFSPDSASRKRQSDVSDFQSFSLSPPYAIGARKNEYENTNGAYKSAFADILDGHSRVSPKSYVVKSEGKHTNHDNLILSSVMKRGQNRQSEFGFKQEMNMVPLSEGGNSPLQLGQAPEQTDDIGGMSASRRRSLDFSKADLNLLSPTKSDQMIPRSVSVMSPPQVACLGLEEPPAQLLPIHPLNDGSGETTSDPSDEKGNGPDYPDIQATNTNTVRNLDGLAQSPIAMRPGITRREDIIDSPAVKEATDAAVAAAMRANAEVAAKKTSPKRPQRAAAAGVAAAAAAAAAGTSALAIKSRKTYSPSRSFFDTDGNTQEAVSSMFTQTTIPGMSLSQGGVTKCNCKKSKCLKLYCECFKASGYCGDGCSCVGCSNRFENLEDIKEAREAILLRNPQAFVDKIAETVTPSKDGSVSMSGPQHRRGCNCKKSKCLKKYCECYQAGVACGDHCKCCGCHNTVENVASRNLKEIANRRIVEHGSIYANDKSNGVRFPVITTQAGLATFAPAIQQMLAQKAQQKVTGSAPGIPGSKETAEALSKLFGKEMAKGFGASKLEDGQILVPIPWSATMQPPDSTLKSDSKPLPIDLTPVIASVGMETSKDAPKKIGDDKELNDTTS